jgi:hypothetical protein
MLHETTPRRNSDPYLHAGSWTVPTAHDRYNWDAIVTPGFIVTVCASMIAVNAPKFVMAGVLIALAGLIAGCSTLSTVPSTHPATEQEKDRLADHVVSGPMGWTTQTLANPITGCTESTNRSSGWLASAMRVWTQTPAVPAASVGGTRRRLQVCLSLYVTPADAAIVRTKNANQMNVAEHPPTPPSSIPVPVDVPGVPGAMGTFIDFSTVGQESIVFARGNVVAWIYDSCAPGGGPSCAIGIWTAQRQYRNLPGSLH